MYFKLRNAPKESLKNVITTDSMPGENTETDNSDTISTNYKANSDIKLTLDWITKYYTGYHKFMRIKYPDYLRDFENDIHPPKRIGDCIGIMQGKNTLKDYVEIEKITSMFCKMYPNPESIPEEFK
jgi:hypothetical protein